jgi:FMN phosphatase YigB (HAD superfamily)
MLAPLSGIEEALAKIENATGRMLDAAEREDAIRAWRAAVPTAMLFPDSLPVLDRLRERRPGVGGSSPDPNRASRVSLSPAGSDSRIRLGLVSNTQSFDLEFVRASGLADRFDAVRYSWETGLLKPDPRAFHAAAGALGLSPSEVLMVGDNLRDDVGRPRRGSFRGPDPAPGLDVLLSRAARRRAVHHETRGDRRPAALSQRV